MFELVFPAPPSRCGTTVGLMQGLPAGQKIVFSMESFLGTGVFLFYCTLPAVFLFPRKSSLLSKREACNVPGPMNPWLNRLQQKAQRGRCCLFLKTLR